MVSQTGVLLCKADVVAVSDICSQIARYMLALETYHHAVLDSALDADQVGMKSSCAI